MAAMKKKSEAKENIGIVLKEIIRLEKGMDTGFSELHAEFNDLQQAVDDYASKADTYFQEMVMLNHRVDRLEKWIMQIAGEMDLKLKP